MGRRSLFRGTRAVDEFPSLSWGSSLMGEPRGLAQGPNMVQL